MVTNQEKLFHKILKENIIWELAGWENALADGSIDQKEYNEIMTEETALEIANDLMKTAWKEGHLTSNMSPISIEAKHLKFMGTERIEHLKKVACLNALVELIRG